jgi:hypothetical protein
MLNHRYQLGYGTINLCGQANAAPIIEAVTGQVLTPLQVGQQTGTADGSFTSFAELIMILDHFGVPVTWDDYERPATIEWHRAVLARGAAAITLVDYRKLTNKAPGFTGYRYAHFVTPVRIEGDTVWLHDTLKQVGPTMEPLASFTAAINSPSLYRAKVGEDEDGHPIYEDRANMPNQALAVEGVMQAAGGIAGINLDYRNPVGSPAAAKLKGFRYARFPYNVSNGTGSQDLNEAASVYGPRIDELRAAGIASIIVLNHQTWGEEQGFNWKQMSDADWDRFIDGFVYVVGRIAQRHADKGIVWQIGNENDNDDVSNVASVYIPPDIYGKMFSEAYNVIKSVDPTSRVIVGGLVTGPGKGKAYFNAAKIAIHDGIGIHLYGVGAGGLYNQFGAVESQLAEWRTLNQPLWVTEFGVLEKPNEPVERVAAYASAFMKACAGKVQAACWYGWGEGMHNGYGVENAGVIRQPLFNALTASQSTPPTQPSTKARPYLMVAGLKPGWILNVRTRPTTSAPAIAQLKNGSLIKPLDETLNDGVNVWAEIELPDGKTGWASTNAAGELSVKL